MRHRKAGVKLNRTTSHRQAMFRNMVTSLFKHNRIRTTDVKAKELRRWADHIITLAKRGDLHARRQVLAIMPEKNVVHKLFEEAGQRFGSINGGYTRIVKIGRRPGDAAPVSMIELVAAQEPASKQTKSKPDAKKKAADVKEKSAKTAEKDAAGVSAPESDAAIEAQQSAPEQAPGESATDDEVQEDAAAQPEPAAADQPAGAPVEAESEQPSEEPDKK